MIKFFHSLCCLTCFAGSAFAQQPFDFTFLSATNPTPNNAAEILTYTGDGFRVGSTFSDTTNMDPLLHTYGVVTYQMNPQGVLFNETIIDFRSTFPGANVTSTAFDPARRGFGVVALSPRNDQDVLGRVGFYNYRTNQILGTAEVGFHPDSVTFNADGSRLIVVNEGEHPADFATSMKSVPGSLSIIDLTGIQDVNVGPAGQFSGLTAFTKDLSGVDISQARIVPGGPTPAFHQLEPEFAAVSGNTVYVTLQEANAVGVFNLAANVAQSDWVAVRGLGTITQTIDGSNLDGPNNTATAAQNDVVRGIPQPDAIATFQINGVEYYVTANEGDARTDNADVATVSTLKTENKLDASLTTGANDITTNDRLGPLTISRIDGDTDADGDIDVPTMLGTRSFSVWNAATGAMVYDSGSLESLVLALDPRTHNINRTLASFDARSTQKGPEPEALTIGTFDGKTYLLLATERQNGLFAFDLSNPANVTFVDYYNALTDERAANDFLLSPESLIFVDAANSPTGRSLVLAGHEGTGLANNTDGILVLTTVPEPTSALAGIACLCVGLSTRRRNRR